MSTLAAHQPYLLPHFSYFQLIHAADVFVFLDNVNFITRGWINRNRLLTQAAEYYFTMPVNHASQNRLIIEHDYVLDKPWQQKFLQTIHHAYHDAPYYENTKTLLHTLLAYDDNNVARFNKHACQLLMHYLQINTPIYLASELSLTTVDDKTQRICELCQHFSANQYLNAIGGRDIYQATDFNQHDIELSFLASKNQQEDFQYSILHLLMHYSVEQLIDALKDYKILQADLNTVIH